MSFPREPPSSKDACFTILKTVAYCKAKALVRRQNLPNGALKDFGEAAKQCDTEKKVIAVSHGWRNQAHPDPGGDYAAQLHELRL